MMPCTQTFPIDSSRNTRFRCTDASASVQGEVYRARDTKLDRDVAIKVLPDEFAKDEERLARFEREAKLLASLNHPNIASIYGLEESGGVKALVLELVEGPTLAERIQEGPIPIEEALPIARQIAEALEAGHEAGVIHRDLKPANAKVKEDGTVKVLDYGLAKALEGEAPASRDSELSQSPTLTRHGTQIGVILGTAAYMSPEQAKGKRVDKRTDIWAFGAVVYEMLTGTRAFHGGDVAEVLASVIKSEPDWAALPGGTPVSLQRVLRLCLTKDVKGRFRDIGDVQLAIGAFDTVPTADPTEGPSSGGWRRAIAITGAAGVLFIVTGVAISRMSRPVESPRPVARVSIPLPAGVSLHTASRRAVALSPDGSGLVYNANGQLYYRAMNQTVATALRGTEGASGPFFSPDSAWVGFWAEGQLWKVGIRGGAPVSLCDARDRAGSGVWGSRWGADNTIVFGQRGTGIMRVSADGGTPEVLISFPDFGGDVSHGPQLLPDHKAVLFTLTNGGKWDDTRIVVQSLETGERKLLIQRGSDARYLATGHLVYVQEGTLFAVPFDMDELAVAGSAIPMAEGVMMAGTTSVAAQFSVSDNGSLIYLPGTEAEGKRALVWVDRDGKEEAIAAEPRGYTSLHISPDEGRVALDVRDQENDIWIWDFDRETLSRLTFSPGVDMYPIWTPDGRRVAFGSTRGGIPNVYWKESDGTGAIERLTESETAQFPNAFTSDGRQLLFFDETGGDLGMLSLEGSAELLLATEFDERNADISPDGRWLAYASNVSGQYGIYVRPFPNVEEGQWLISKDGGTQPLWAPDGRELFYLAPGSRLMAVGVETKPGFTPGDAQELFGGYYARQGRRTYDVSPDGERFLMIKEGAGRGGEGFILVQNWFEELKRLVPTGR